MYLVQNINAVNNFSLTILLFQLKLSNFSQHLTYKFFFMWVLLLCISWWPLNCYTTLQIAKSFKFIHYALKTMTFYDLIKTFNFFSVLFKSANTWCRSYWTKNKADRSWRHRISCRVWMHRWPHVVVWGWL